MVDGWQPIETAPKDGTHILAFCRIEDEDGAMVPLVYVMKFVRTRDRDHWQEASGDNYYTFSPTHWMPLPNPPVSDG